MPPVQRLSNFRRANSAHIGWLVLVVVSLLLIGVVIVTVASKLVAANMVAKHNQEIDREVAEVTDRLQAQMDTYTQLLYSSRAFVTSQPNLTRLQWQQFYLNSGVTKRLPGVGLLVYMKRVPASQKAAFIAATRADTSLNPDGYPRFSIIPEENKDEYMVVDYIEPFSPTTQQQMFGFDYSSDLVRRVAFEKARDNNFPVMSSPVKSVNDRAVTVMIVFLPVYDARLAPVTVEDRRQALLGFTVVGIRTQPFFDQVFKDLLEEDLELQVFDGTELTPEHRLYDSRKQLQVLGASTDSGKLNGALIRTKTIVVADRTWTLLFQLTPDESSGVVISSLTGRIAILIGSNIGCAVLVWWLATRRSKKKI